MNHTRNNFTKETQRRAFARSGGVCECHLMPHVFKTPCGRRLTDGRIRYEHIEPDAICGRNDIDNCAVLVLECWRYKTDTYDQRVIAKTRRVSDLARGIKDPWRKKLPGARDSDVRMTMRHGPVDRRTGEPIGGRR